MTVWAEDDDIVNRLKDFIDYLESVGFESLNSGSFRVAYIRGKVVIKVPYNTDGMIDNKVEAKAYRHYRNNPTSRQLYLAPCRMLANGCLMMVVVDTSIDVDSSPAWTHRVDRTQVGMYKSRYVAYDYACDIVERSHWERQWFGEIKSEWYSGTLRAERRAEREGFLKEEPQPMSETEPG